MIISSHSWRLNFNFIFVLKRDVLTTQELNSFLVAPEKIGAEALETLRLFRDKYPYSPVFAALYAKGLHNAMDLNYDEELRKAAIILPERSVLYQLIYKSVVQDKIKEIEEVSTKEEQIEESVFVGQEIEIEEGQIVEEEVLEDPEREELERTVILEAINNAIQLDVDDLLEEEISDSIEDWKEPVKEIEKAEEPVFQPKRFSDWLMPADQKNLLPKKEEEVAPLLSSKDLIDRFIKQSSHKIDVTKDPISPKEMGSMSLMEDDTFVTETLAEIYAKQGKFQKAIKIYEQLSLKIPEKKTFFASRIRFLKEKMEYE